MRARVFFTTMIVVAGVVILNEGCKSTADKETAEPKPEMRALGQPVSTTSTNATDQPTDTSIGSEIRRLLDADPLSSASIIVEVDDGNVTLRGSVANVTAAARAEGLTHSVKGVKSVTNQILVTAPNVVPNRTTVAP